MDRDASTSASRGPELFEGVGDMRILLYNALRLAAFRPVFRLRECSSSRIKSLCHPEPFDYVQDKLREGSRREAAGFSPRFAWQIERAGACVGRGASAPLTQNDISAQVRSPNLYKTIKS